MHIQMPSWIEAMISFVPDLFPVVKDVAAGGGKLAAEEIYGIAGVSERFSGELLNG
jgi:hypothetical protein